MPRFGRHNSHSSFWFHLEKLEICQKRLKKFLMTQLQLCKVKITNLMNFMLNKNFRSTTTESPVLGVYEGCGTRKLCFGFPLKCIKSRDCELFGAVIHDENDKFIFELLSVRKLFALSILLFLSIMTRIQTFKPENPMWRWPYQMMPSWAVVSTNYEQWHW